MATTVRKMRNDNGTISHMKGDIQMTATEIEAHYAPRHTFEKTCKVQTCPDCEQERVKREQRNQEVLAEQEQEGLPVLIEPAYDGWDDEEEDDDWDY